MLLLLTALLSRLPDAPAPRPPLWVLVVCREAAIGAELLDRRECRNLFVHPYEFKIDIGIIAGRACDLAGAPPLSACMLLPARWLVVEMLVFNGEYQSHLKDAQYLDPRLSLDVYEALTEARQLCELWEHVRDARYECYHTTARRRDLKAIQEAVGAEAFKAGVFPPHIPLWRMRKVN